MLTLHHLESSRSQRIIWLMEELGLDYTVVNHPRDPETNLAPESLEKIHPLGKAPVLIDNGEAIVESAAIVEHLIDKAGGRLRPQPSTEAAKLYTFWMHFAEGSIMPTMVMNKVFSTVESAPMPFFLKPWVSPVAKGISRKVKSSYIHPTLTKQFNFIEKHLTSHEWFCGDQLTGADFMMSLPLEAAVAVKSRLIDTLPHIQRYVQTIHHRPAYQRALEKGGTYEFA